MSYFNKILQKQWNIELQANHKFSVTITTVVVVLVWALKKWSVHYSEWRSHVTVIKKCVTEKISNNTTVPLVSIFRDNFFKPDSVHSLFGNSEISLLAS